MALWAGDRWWKGGGRLWGPGGGARGAASDAKMRARACTPEQGGQGYLRQELGRAEPSPRWCPPSQTGGPNCCQTLGEKPPLHHSEALAPGLLPHGSPPIPLPTPGPRRHPLEISSNSPGDCRPWLFPRNPFLRLSLTFGLGLAPGRHCFASGAVFIVILFLKSGARSGGSGSLLGWAVSLWAGDWVVGRCRWLGVGGGRGQAFPETEEVGRGVPGRKPCGWGSAPGPGKASGVFLLHWVHCVSQRPQGRTPGFSHRMLNSPLIYQSTGHNVPGTDPAPPPGTSRNSSCHPEGLKG